MVCPNVSGYRITAGRILIALFFGRRLHVLHAIFAGYGFKHFGRLVSCWVADVVRHAYKFEGWLFADSAGCSLGRFSHWWRSVWVSVFGERGFHTSVALASTVLLGCQKRGNCTLGQLTSPRFESAFFASFLCRFGQRNDACSGSMLMDTSKRDNSPTEVRNGQTNFSR